jgi:hypothetical protein
MAFTKWSYALRGSLAGLVAVASTAAFGAEAEGVVRIRSNDQKPGVVIRGQSPNDCVPMMPTISSKKTQSGAPVAQLITPRESPAPEPKVTQMGSKVTPIGGEEAAKAEALAAPSALPATAEATGEYAGLFSSESAAPFNKPLQFAQATPAADETVAPAASSNNCKEGVASVGSCPSNGCPPIYYDDCPGRCGPRRVLCNNCFADHMRCHCINHRMRNAQTSAALCAMMHQECEEKFAWFRCKFGYFFPSGSGGKGSAICGHYSMVYPVDANYQDPRDCQVYSAQGYYGPVAVPLAPVVHHTYNYGWGVPSSRLTPVSHPIATPYPAYPYPY